MNSSGCGVAGTTGWENGSDGKVSETSSLQTRLQRREKRAPKLSVSRVARQSRDVSTTVAENFRVFWKGCEAKASVGEKRAGARRTWPSRRDLSVRPSKRILSSASDELLRVERGRGGQPGRPRARSGARSVPGKSRVNGAPAVDFAATKQTRRARAIETTRARNIPDELAEEDLLVRVEGLCRKKGWTGQIRSGRRAKPSAASASKVGAGSSLACRDSPGRKRHARASRRGETHVDDQRQKLVDLSLEGERLGFLRHGRRWGVERVVQELRWEKWVPKKSHR